MPFLQDLPAYREMTRFGGELVAAIESLDVQVSWANATLVGVPAASVDDFDALFDAVSGQPGGGIERGLASFTREVFSFGNVAVFVAAGGALAWPPDWRTSNEHVNVLAQGTLLEAKRPPIGADNYGTPILQAALRPYQQYVRLHQAQMAQLHGGNPAPLGGVAAQVQAMNAVLQAVGFTPDPGGAIYGPAQALQTEMRTLFEVDLLAPFAAHLRIAGNPTIQV
jgi:hypothetical protein